MTMDGARNPNETSLIEAIYDAALEPSAWAELMPRLVAGGGGSGGSLFLMHPRLGAEMVYSDTLSAGDLARYETYFQARDPWLQGATAKGLFRSGSVMLDRDLADRRRFERSEFCNEWARPLGIEGACGVVLHAAERESEACVMLAVHRGPRKPDFGPAEVAFLKRMTPHLGRSARFGLRLRVAQADGFAARGALQHLPWAVILLDAAGDVVGLNAAAEQALLGGDVLRLRARRLACVAPGDGGAFAAAVRRAAGGGGADLRLRLASGDPGPVAVVLPLIPDSRPLVPGAARVVVHLLDRSGIPASLAGRLSGLFGLTRAELRLASNLLVGLTTAEIAARHGLSAETVKSQMRSLFARTQTSRQAELVAVLARYAAMPRAEPAIHPEGE